MDSNHQSMNTALDMMSRPGYERESQGYDGRLVGFVCNTMALMAVESAIVIGVTGDPGRVGQSSDVDAVGSRN
jgi:hypothetical protein